MQSSILGSDREMAVAFDHHPLVLPVWVMKPHSVCRGWKGMSRDIPQLREPDNFSDLRTGGEGDHRLGLVGRERMGKRWGASVGRSHRTGSLVGETIDGLVPH